MPSLSSDRLATIAAQPQDFMRDALARGLLASERLRLSLFAACLGAVVLLTVLVGLVFPEAPVRLFSTHLVLVVRLAILCAAIAYELFVRWRIGLYLRRGRQPPSYQRYVTAMVETSLPSLVLL